MQLKRGKSIEITDQMTSESASIIASWIGCYTVIKNQKTQQAKSDYGRWLEAGSDTENRPKTNTQVAYLSKELPFLKEIPSQIRRNAGAKWLEAMNAAKSGLRKQPTVRKKHQKRNCYVTNELFDVQHLDEHRCLIQLKNNAMKGAKGRVMAGFVMPFSKENAGNALFLSRKGSRFWLSMSFDKTFDVLSPKEVKARVVSLDDDELLANILGIDLGVVQQATDSGGFVYHMDDFCQQKLAELEQKTKRYQRRAARIFSANERSLGKKHKRTSGEKKALAKVAKIKNKITNISHNNVHQLSKQIAENTPLVAVFENMTISHLLKAPKVKLCPETGKWLPNGRAAKRGLNRVISNANMGKIRQFSEYKLIERGKLFLTVKTAYSSQTCNACGFCDKGNRTTQEKFSCLSCFHTENADINAAKVLRQRGLQHIRSDKFTQVKTVRKTSARSIMAREKASIGCGDNVRLSFEKATVDDVLNIGLTAP